MYWKKKKRRKSSVKYLKINTALENSISVIEDPPRTGKTQTIMNSSV